MPHLKYYQTENQSLPEWAKLNTPDRTIEYYFDRLKSRYKFRQKLLFHGRGNGGNCNSWRVRVSHDCSIGVLAHEVGHAIQFRKRGYYDTKGTRWHCNEHRKITARVLKTIETNITEWNFTLAKKVERGMQVAITKEIKEKEKTTIKATPDYKLQKLRESIKVWESKRKRAETALKKLRRREKLWVKKVQSEGLKSPSSLLKSL